jgi:hypothetical protein
MTCDVSVWEQMDDARGLRITGDSRDEAEKNLGGLNKKSTST